MLLLMFRIIYKYRYSYGIEDIGVSSHDVLSSSIGESACFFNVGPSMICPTSVHNESDDNDANADDNVVQENSVQVAAEEDENNTKLVDNAYANNEYVELKDLYPDEFQSDD